MSQVSLIGIDIAKSVFHLHGADALGKTVLKRRFTRLQLIRELGKMSKSTVVMEACSGSNFLAKKFQAMGHEVKLIPAQFVKPFLKGNKNDASDAEAIVEAASRPNMRFVPVKSNWHLDIQMIHRVRQRLVRNRTALCNEVRAVLFEYGFVIPKGVEKLRSEIIKLQQETENELSQMARTTVADLHSELLDIEERLLVCEQRLDELTRDNELCKKLQTIRGVGSLTASALVAAVPAPHVFKNGRHFSAWVGLVPRHTGTGGQNRLLGISKRGNCYLRKLLIHGSRSTVLHAHKRNDRLSKWAVRIKDDRGYNKACVALANKNARIIWALMTKRTEFKDIV